MRTLSHQHRAAQGFSLVEVLCAVLILGVGLVGLVQGLTTALASHRDSEVETTAALLAASRIELIQAEGFVVAGEDHGEFSENSTYQWRQTITETSTEGLFEVRVTVEKAPAAKTVYELHTLLFDPPLTLTEDTKTGGTSGSSSSSNSRSKERSRR